MRQLKFVKQYINTKVKYDIYMSHLNIFYNFVLRVTVAANKI